MLASVQPCGSEGLIAKLSKLAVAGVAAMWLLTHSPASEIQRGRESLRGGDAW
jgi:hypothetical protein